MCFVDGWDDPPEVCFVEERRARKVHECGDCSKPIQPGQRYYLLKGLYDGSWDTSRRCQRCETVATALERRVERYNRERGDASPWRAREYLIPWGALSCCLHEWIDECAHRREALAESAGGAA